MRRIITLLLLLSFAITVNAQLLMTDSAFSSDDQGTTFQLQTVTTTFHDASNCRPATIFGKQYDPVSQQLNNYFYSTIDYYANGTQRQSVTQSWDNASSMYVNAVRFTNTYYQATNKALTSLLELWNGTAWQNSTLLTNTYDANGYLTVAVNESWNTQSGTWQKTLETVYYNKANGLADSSIAQTFIANFPIGKTKYIYTYQAASSLLSQEITQTFLIDHWEDSRRSTYTYNTSGKVLTIIYESFSQGAWISAGREVDTYNTDGNLAVQTNYNGAATTQSRFSYTPCNTLPVTLLNLNAEKQKNDVLLSWSTASEDNSAYFDIERSADNLPFVSVGVEKAAGNINTRINYHFTDNIAALNNSKQLFYRLRQVDKDGKFIYSTIVRVTNENSVQISIVPNPAKDHIFILHDNTVDLNNSFLSITDMAGKTVLKQKFQQKDIPVSSFAKGVYIIQLTTPTQTITRKLFINK